MNHRAKVYILYLEKITINNYNNCDYSSTNCIFFSRNCTYKREFSPIIILIGRNASNFYIPSKIEYKTGNFEAECTVLINVISCFGWSTSTWNGIVRSSFTVSFRFSSATVRVTVLPVLAEVRRDGESRRLRGASGR